MTYHIRKHHPQISVPVNHTRGRKPLTRADEFERSKYSMFFQSSKRKAKNDEIMNIENVVENVFNSIFKGKYSNKLFSHPKNYEEHYILNKLANKTIFDVGKNNNVITCDTVFLEYLMKCKERVNEKYFTLLIKFIVLIKECYDIHKNKFLPFEEWQKYSDKNLPQDIPDICNEFYGSFLAENGFFGIDDRYDRLEIIEIIQHFCTWLLKNHYTKSKLGLANNVDLNDLRFND